MQRALSTRVFSDAPLTESVLDEIYAAEIPFVEIYCTREHLDYRNRTQLASLGKYFASSQLQAHSLHSPVDWHGTAITITEPVRSKRKELTDEIKRAIETAEAIPFRYFIQHLGVEGEAFSGRAVDAAFESLMELEKFARDHGAELLLENIPNDLSGCERLLEFFDVTKLPLNVCLDLGHAHRKEGVANAFDLLKDRIRSVHVHDNNGKADSHDLPFQGTIDWARAMTLLRSQADRYPLLLELTPASVVEMATPLDAVRKAFDELDEIKEEEREQ